MVILHRILILLIISPSFSCSIKSTNQEAIPLDHERSSNSHFPNDSLWALAGNRSVFWPDTSMVHNFKDFDLQWMNLDDRGEYRSIGSKLGTDVTYREFYPNIVTCQLRGEKISTIKYYSDGQLIKELKLKDLNPYIKRSYDNLSFGYIEFESHFLHPVNEFGEGTIADSYLTNYSIAPTTINGLTLISYQLISLYKDTVLDWESCINVFDTNGQLIAIHNEDNYTYPVGFDEEANVLAYLYRNKLNEFSDSKPRETFKVVDLFSDSTLLEITPESGVGLGTPRQLNRLNGMIMINYQRELLKGRVTLDFVDLNSRMRYIKKFADEEFTSAINEYQGYIPLIQTYSFDQTKF